jgi:hypothetical protein
MIQVETGVKNDLVVITADANMQAGVNAILKRPEALGIRPITFQVIRHPQRDPGCRVYGASFSQLFINQFSYCLLIFDFEGCGEENISIQKLEERIDGQLKDIGWVNKAKTIIINPELEIWVWTDSIYVDEALGWKNRVPSLRDFLMQEGYLQSGNIKPLKPKEAVESALRTVRIPRSSNIYQSLAEKISLQKCQDSAFNRFKSTLLSWFPNIEIK